MNVFYFIKVHHLGKSWCTHLKLHAHDAHLWGSQHTTQHNPPPSPMNQVTLRLIVLGLKVWKIWPRQNSNLHIQNIFLGGHSDLFWVMSCLPTRCMNWPSLMALGLTVRTILSRHNIGIQFQKEATVTYDWIMISPSPLPRCIKWISLIVLVLSVKEIWIRQEKPNRRTDLHYNMACHKTVYKN